MGSPTPRVPQRPAGFNGAAVRGRRKFMRGVQHPMATTQLQLGRRPRTAEMRRSRASPNVVRLLQWGRRPRTAEICYRASSSRVSHQLQWGRRPRTAEIVKNWRGNKGGNNASMGPPSEDGGNLVRGNADAHVTQLQWGRRPRTAEISRSRRATVTPRSSFNGAAVRGRRKSTRQRVDCIHSIQASMGPPSEDGGNPTGEELRIRQIKASMGPPSEDGGNPKNLWPSYPCVTSLQWGRRPRTAEICGSQPSTVTYRYSFNGAAVRGRRKYWCRAWYGGSADASMGPPSEDGGNYHPHPWRIPAQRRFNGAAVRGRRKYIFLALDTPG